MLLEHTKGFVSETWPLKFVAVPCNGHGNISEAKNCSKAKYVRLPSIGPIKIPAEIVLIINI